LNERGRAPADGANLARDIHAMPGVGVAAHVLQGRGLEILRVRIDLPALVLVDRGTKAVQTQRGPAVHARPRQALVLGDNQTVDFTNAVLDGAHYEARWLLFDRSVIDDPYYRGRASLLERTDRSPASARLVSRVQDNLAAAFERARQALVPGQRVPAPVARQRVLEVMHWLLEEGIVLHNSPVDPGVSIRVRALIAGRLDCAWTADRVARELAQSEATLRRRLAAEGTSLKELLVDARMAMALTLLQATTQPVSAIALAVGYECPSRFAVRFRQRFGFAPTAVRGHERAT
jgi:AraC-like DNA-binding protein